MDLEIGFFWSDTNSVSLELSTQILNSDLNILGVMALYTFKTVHVSTLFARTLIVPGCKKKPK